MTFNTITVNFESAEEQKLVENNIPLAIYEHDTQGLWTEFDISGCEPADLAEYFGDFDEEDLDFNDEDDE